MIVSVAHYVPEKILTNFELEKMVETNDEWITKRTGIKERYITIKNELPSDMGLVAAKQALENANIYPDDIDIIICATITSDYITPATACIDPKNRKLMKISLEDEIEADKIFSTLMGDNVEPRKIFIQTHALEVNNLDI